MNQRLHKAYDPESFRRMGHRLVDQLADDLANIDQQPALDWSTPDELESSFSDVDSPHPVNTTTEDRANQLFAKTLRHSIRLHQPQFMGHQISPSVPLAALAGFACDYLNNGMGVYEMGMAGTAMEREVIRATANQFNFPASADGVLTSGGTLANLTAMLAARHFQLLKGNITPEDASRLTIFASDQSHYCIDRAAKIMGLTTDGVVKIPTNDRFQMNTDLLPKLHAECTARGQKVIAVVGSACSTSTGSFDNLEAIGQFAQSHQLWFHVDGAHGAALAFSSRFKERLRGVANADSVVLDFHKMLLTPAIVSALIFRNGDHGYETFRQEAEYLWDSTDREWFNLAKRTFECTKNMMSLKIYAILNAYGIELFDEYVTAQVELASDFARLIEARELFELAVQPECNIVCFRIRSSETTADESNRLNAIIRKRLVEDGRYYIVQTTIDESIWLRTTLSNPFTTANHLNGLLDTIESLAANIKRDTE
jgi:L-2,4-diaminobutyrate decarboxylase